MMNSLASQPAATIVLSSTRRLLSIALCVVSGGCASMMPSSGNWLEKEPEFVSPNKVIPVWSDTVLHQAGQAGTRGCGGRIMFYSGDGKRAVRVDGSLVVYAWDDSKPQKDRQPDRKFVFPKEDFQKHYSGSTIGDSYSFWLPWDAAGGERKELTLVARFVSRDGAEVTSSAAKVILPGAVPLPDKEVVKREDPSSSDEPNQPPSGIQQVAFEQTKDSSTSNHALQNQHSLYPATGLTTSEIPLTDGFLRRNMNGTQPAAFSAGDLFADPSTDQQSTTERSDTDSSSSAVAPTQTSSGAGHDISGAPTTVQPGGRSLRFRYRVRNSREAQRSVGRALSERYQTGSRTAPWEQD